MINLNILIVSWYTIKMFKMNYDKQIRYKIPGGKSDFDKISNILILES